MTTPLWPPKPRLLLMAALTSGSTTACPGRGRAQMSNHGTATSGTECPLVSPALCSTSDNGKKAVVSLPFFRRKKCGSVLCADSRVPSGT
jgi:hypothetical protein